MKQKIRILVLILAICVTVCSMTSCSASFWKGLIRIEKPSTEESVTTTATQAPVEEPEPTVPSELEYRLTQEDVDAFYEVLAQCEAAYLNADSTDEELTALEDRVNEAYYHIVSQAQLAYLHYCLDMQDSGRSADYLFAADAESDIYEAYMQMCRRMDEAETPWKDRFFEGWSEKDLAEMRGFSTELTELQKENDQLLVDYRSLSDDAFYEGSAEYYVRLVQNHNRIAELMGYENYWTYAFAEIYHRDYGEAELEQMRSYVKRYLIPTCQDAKQAFVDRYAQLSEAEQALIADLLEREDYDSFSTDFLGGYLSTLGEDAGEKMKDMLNPENSFFTDSEAAHVGAFTIYLYEVNRPVCFFGPGYQGLDTVLHEMGHYYSYRVNGRRGLQMDLSEVQSQGNEWLFGAYLNGVLDSDVAKTVEAYRLYSALRTVIKSTMIDEFEQLCYESSLLTVERANEIMDLLEVEYGGEAWLLECVEDMDLYWRLVTVDQPVYYVSYAVSMLAAIQIYCVAENQSYETGMETYLALMKPETNSLLKCLEKVGLKTPMDESLYLDLRELI